MCHSWYISTLLLCFILELDLTANFDRVFWLGDLNFRVTLDRSKVDELLEKYKDQENPECKVSKQHSDLGLGFYCRDLRQSKTDHYLALSNNHCTVALQTRACVHRSVNTLYFSAVRDQGLTPQASGLYPRSAISEWLAWHPGVLLIMPPDLFRKMKRHLMNWNISLWIGHVQSVLLSVMLTCMMLWIPGGGGGGTPL